MTFVGFFSRLVAVTVFLVLVRVPHLPFWMILALLVYCALAWETAEWSGLDDGEDESADDKGR